MSDRRRRDGHGARPPGQRWIKRPPRPSRPAPPQPAIRVRPGWGEALTGIGFGLVLGIMAAVLVPMLTDRPGIPGLVAGLSFGAGFALVWRAAGGTLADIRALVR